MRWGGVGRRDKVRGQAVGGPHGREAGGTSSIVFNGVCGVSMPGPLSRLMARIMSKRKQKHSTDVNANQDKATQKSDSAVPSIVI